MNLEQVFSIDYKDYTAEMFLSDENFVTWAKHPGESPKLDLYWKMIKEMHPELEPEIKKATGMVKVLSCQKVYVDESKMSDSWKMIRRRIVFTKPVRALNNGKVVIMRYRAVAAAMLIILLTAGAAVGGHFFRLPHSGDNSLTTVYSPSGQRTEITLPDNSRVWLNARTTLRYSADFNKENREIFLDGEAYFDVKKGKIPFEVRTEAMVIKVLGTAFNVKCYSDDITAEATLVRGSLRVEKLNAITGNKEEILLTPNQKVVFLRDNSARSVITETGTAKEKEITVRKGENPIAVRQVDLIRSYDTGKSTGWIDGVLYIEGESLGELSRKIERRYDVNFVFMNENLKNFKYTGTLREYSLEQVMNAISSTSPISYSVDKQTVYVGENKDEINRYLKLMKK